MVYHVLRYLTHLGAVRALGCAFSLYASCGCVLLPGACARELVCGARAGLLRVLSRCFLGGILLGCGGGGLLGLFLLGAFREHRLEGVDCV